MAFDAMVVRALTAELSEKLISGRIDKIYQPERDEITLGIRTRENNFKLALSASAAHPRVHLTSVSKKNPDTAPMFCMLLRKHIGGGKITAIEQDGFERVIRITVESYDELGDLTEKYLIAEIMGRHSNIILTDRNMKIIDCIKHIDFTVSSVRQLLPGLTYESAPPQNKTELTSIGDTAMVDFSEAIIGADKALMNAVSGISPLTARELVYRAFNRTDIKCGELTDSGRNKLLYELVRLSKTVKNNEFEPCMLINTTNGKLMDFSAVAIGQYEKLAEIKRFDNINALLDEFYKTRDSAERMKQKSADLVRLLNNNIERVSKKLLILGKTLASSKDKEKYRIYGDLITANIYAIPQGAASAEVLNYFEEGSPVINIPLDAALTPSQNAQGYYKRYNKAKTAEIEAAKQAENAKNELEYLESALASVELAADESDLSAIRAELIREGYIKSRQDKKRKKETVSKPLHLISSDGYDIYIGKNNTQNDYLTLKLANSSDMWFHTKKIHGSHVIIKLGAEKEIPNTTIREAAEVAAYHSKARGSSQVPVDYTRVKNVKKPNGAKPGMVIYEGYNTIYVTPSEHSDKTMAEKK